MPHPIAQRFFAKHEFQSPYLLCCSDCEALTLKELLELADPDSLQRWGSLKLNYTESQGLPALREAISGLYENISPDQLVCCVPEEGIYLTMMSLLQPGDVILTTFPAYQSLYEVAHSLGCSVKHWEPKPSARDAAAAGDTLGRLAFDVEELCSAGLPAGTKLLVVNFPHNPTGATISQEGWQQLIQLCKQAGVWLFSDEMYKFTEAGSNKPLPSGAEVYERGISLCGLSKSWGLPGLRLGWLACQDKQLLQDALAFKDYTTICNPGPSEILALAAVRATPQLTQRCRDIIAVNTQLANTFFARWEHVFEYHPPEGGPIAFPRLTTGEDIATWCDQLVSESGVLLLPSSIYDHARSDQQGHFRIGLGRKDCGKCLEQLEAWLLKRYRHK
eukprot:gene3038-3319_t